MNRADIRVRKEMQLGSQIKNVLWKSRYLLLAGTMLSTLEVPQWSAASDRFGPGTIILAQGQPGGGDPNDPRQKGQPKGKQAPQQKGPPQGQPGPRQGGQPPQQPQPRQGGQPPQQGEPQPRQSTPSPTQQRHGIPPQQQQQVQPQPPQQQQVQPSDRQPKELRKGPQQKQPPSNVQQRQGLPPQQGQPQQQNQPQQQGQPQQGQPPQGQRPQGVRRVPADQMPQPAPGQQGRQPAQGQQVQPGGPLPKDQLRKGQQQKQLPKDAPQQAQPVQPQQPAQQQPAAPGQQPAAPGQQPPVPGRQPAQIQPGGAPPAGRPPGQPTDARQQQFQQQQGAGNVEQLRSQRRERVESGGRTIIEEPGRRQIVRDRGGQVFIRHDESERFRFFEGARVERRGSENYTIIRRPGGVEIISVTDGNGRLLRRIRRGPDRREVVLIDNRPRGGAGFFLDLAPPVVSIPRERYIVDVSEAQPAMLYEALEAPPLEPIERAYSLDEIRYNVALRDRMRRVDIDTINFETGSWEVTPDQAPALQAIADAIMRVISRNPGEVFLIEGHTDKVGSDDDNLSLSDRRAESIANILTGDYQIPPENLVTQGYGEQYPKVDTEEPSRENRRVTVRRITPLLQGASR
jgi:outer membrane protein OmpA-like peptidoglycan-associated protein